VCPEVLCLTLDMSEGHPLHMAPGRYYFARISWRSSVSLTNRDRTVDTIGMTFEEEIDHAVKLLVEGLPGLKKLQLGDYKYKTVPKDEDEWGKSVR